MMVTAGRRQQNQARSLRVGVAVAAGLLIASGTAQAGLFRCTTRKESARGGSGGGNSKPDAATCRKLRDARASARTRLGRMTDKEKMAFAAQQNEVSVACP